MSLIKEVLEALRIPFVEKDGFEADDIIATLATQAMAEDFEVLICTGDRDSFQLVNDRTTVLYPMRGVSEMERMTPAAVEERYGVPPARYPELAALVGETSDNLPGVPGVGPKTAAKWIIQYDGLDNVVNRPTRSRARRASPCASTSATCVRNRQLNALVDDLELPLVPTDLALQPWDRQEVHTVFDGLEFRVLRDRLFENLESEEEVDGPASTSTPPARVRARSAAGSTQHAGRRPGRRAGRGHLAARAPARSPGWRWPPAPAPRPGSTRPSSTPRTTPPWPRGWPTRRCRRCCTTRRGRCSRSPRAAGALDGLERDTALSAYLARPDQRSYDLADLTVRYLKRELKTGPVDDGDQLSLDGIGDDAAGETAMLQARAALDLAEALDDELDDRGGTALLGDVELPLVDVLAGMEQTGIAVDTDHLESLESEFAAGCARRRRTRTT